MLPKKCCNQKEKEHIYIYTQRIYYAKIVTVKKQRYKYHQTSIHDVVLLVVDHIVQEVLFEVKMSRYRHSYHYYLRHTTTISVSYSLTQALPLTLGMSDEFLKTRVAR